MTSIKEFTFCKTGYDPFIDFLKGVCILLILLNHSMSPEIKKNSLFALWGYPAVPIFLMIQVFHAYKKGFGNPTLSVAKMWKRVVRPFLLAETIICTILIILNKATLGNITDCFIYWGGYGPGSYYPWIYIQFAIILPFFSQLFKILDFKRLAFIFIVLSIGGEVIPSLITLPQWLWRLLFLRYIILVYIGYILVIKGCFINNFTIGLSIFSICAILFFELSDANLSPWFYYMPDWNTVHWVCYFYIAFLMLYILKWLYDIISERSMLKRIICLCGIKSYTIFVFQLFYFTILAPYVLDLLGKVFNSTIALGLYIPISIFICSVFGLFIKRFSVF